VGRTAEVSPRLLPIGELNEQPTWCECVAAAAEADRHAGESGDINPFRGMRVGHDEGTVCVDLLGATISLVDYEAQCPYCGEPVMVFVDPSDGQDQTYIEDCPLCCRPWTIHAVARAAGEYAVSLEREGDLRARTGIRRSPDPCYGWLMPIYEYECPSCGNIVEVIMGEPPAACAGCGTPGLRRIMSAHRVTADTTRADGPLCCGRTERDPSCVPGSCCGGSERGHG
jgi:putative FmdB family regulatory protein